MPFLDEVELEISSGKGGAGCLSFRRERYVPRGGPDGGDGGKGGDVYVVARERLTTFDFLGGKRHIRAEKGQPGGPRKRHGKGGDDLYVELPVGTIIRDAERGHVLVELTEPDRPVLFLKGGSGGRGNHSYRSATNQTPRFAQTGGEEVLRRVRLELKLLADVGLVGLPNAGKSTLLGAVSAAQPKVGNYAFTTLAPRIGVLERDFETLTVADLPGLLEGAHEGKGIGDRFLRHVERTRVLVHVIDAAAGDVEQLLERYHIVQNELQQYEQALARKPMLVVLNKCDLRDDPPPSEALSQRLGHPVLAVSALRGEGLADFVARIFALTREAREG